MEAILKKIIAYLSNNQLTEALQLCEKNKEKKIRFFLLLLIY